MLKIYFMIAFRNLLRNKLYSATAVFGLALGLAVCLLAVRYLTYELSFDNFKDRERTYEVCFGMKFGDTVPIWTSTPPHLGEELARAFPVVESTTSFLFKKLPVQKADGLKKEQTLCVADSNILDFFGFRLLQGDLKSCFNSPYAIVLTKTMAEEEFGKNEALGRTLKVNGCDCIVTGVMEDLPQTSSLSFDGIVRDNNASLFYYPSAFTWQITFPAYVFLKIRAGTDMKAFSNALPSFVKSTGGEPDFDKLELVAMKDVHFRTDIYTDFSTYEPKYLYIFCVIGLLVVIVSVVNFIGINMTLFSRRIKEVGIRKVSGAGRGDLIYQFMTENILSTLISIAGAICIAEILLPWFNLMLGIELGMDLFSPMYEILILLGIAFLANIIVSLYATNFFSSLEPESLIRGSFDKTDGKGQFKKILVAYQFAIAAFLISSTIVITDQVNFMNHKDLGFNKDQLLVIDESSIGTRANVIKNDLQKDPDILSITKSTWFPTVGHYTGVSGFQDGWKKPITLHIVDVDENFVPTLGLRLIKGRNFDLVFASDSGTVVVNEEAVKELGIADPMRDSLHFFGNNLKVIGVIKDFNYSSLRDRVEPFAFQFSNNPNSSLAVKIKKGKIKEVVSYLGDVWRRINPDKELHFSFLDDNVNHQYVNEKQIFKALLSGSSIAILIALMSVFALSSFQIETKTKEIAIRKVVGASVPEIVWLLISGFLAMIAAANVVAWPVAYYITEKWLNGFTYRIDISASPFLLTGILVVGISLLTLALRAIKAATANPVESLRYE